MFLPRLRAFFVALCLAFLVASNWRGVAMAARWMCEQITVDHSSTDTAQAPLGSASEEEEEGEGERGDGEDAISRLSGFSHDLEMEGRLLGTLETASETAVLFDLVHVEALKRPPRA